MPLFGRRLHAPAERGTRPLERLGIVPPQNLSSLRDFLLGSALSREVNFLIVSANYTRRDAKFLRFRRIVSVDAFYLFLLTLPLSLPLSKIEAHNNVANQS